MRLDARYRQRLSKWNHNPQYPRTLFPEFLNLSVSHVTRFQRGRTTRHLSNVTSPLVALEEHWYSTTAFNLFDNSLKRGIETWPGALEKLSDADYIRLKDMNRGKVSLQVISHCTADNPSPDLCRVGNDQLANEIRIDIFSWLF